MGKPEEKHSYLSDVFLLITTIAPAIISYIIDTNTGHEEWFQRSGSLMVLFAVLLEYRQNWIETPVIQAFFKVNNGGVLTKIELPPMRKFLKYLAFILILLGTAIWGYGDLIL